MSIVLKSNKAYVGQSLSADLDAYKARVLADGGIIQDPDSLLDAMLFMQEHRFTGANIFSATSASWGVKMVNGTIVKLYSLFDSGGDIKSYNVTIGATLIEDDDGYAIMAGDAASLSSVGFASTRDLSLFTNFKHDPTTEQASVISSFVGINEAQIGINIAYNHQKRTFGVSGYGSLSSTPYSDLGDARGVSASISKEKLQSYIKGEVRDTIYKPATVESNYYRALILSQGAYKYRGIVYLNIAGINMTDEQNQVIAKFTEDFR